MLCAFGPYKLLFLMAAEAEYGAAQKKVFTPHFIGVGPVGAAINTTHLLMQYQRQGQMPDLVVSLGSAGSCRLQQTEVYQVSHVSWRDMDATLLGVAKGVTPFLDMPAILPLPCLLNDMAQASLSTGGNIVSGATYDTIDADMVDMETYAVLRSCQKFNLPLIGFRGISDGASDLHHVDDWTQYLHIIDEKMAQVVTRLKIRLAQGDLAAMM